jgi:hypothetical protein
MTKATRTLLFSAALLVPGLAWAEDINVNLTDHRGRAIDGQVTATPSAGGAAVRCTTRGGRCTVRVSKAGGYSVTARPLAGGNVPPKAVTVRAGRNATVNLQSTAPGTDPVGGGGSGGTVGGTSGTTRDGDGSGSGGGGGSGSGGNVSGGSQAPTGGAAARNLGRGTAVSVRGNTTDARGRPADGTVTFKQDGRTIGTCSTTGGRFMAYDLAPGAYSVTFRSAAGRTGTKSVTVRRGAEVTLNIGVQ